MRFGMWVVSPWYYGALVGAYGRASGVEVRFDFLCRGPEPLGRGGARIGSAGVNAVKAWWVLGGGRLFLYSTRGICYISGAVYTGWTLGKQASFSIYGYMGMYEALSGGSLRSGPAPAVPREASAVVVTSGAFIFRGAHWGVPADNFGEWAEPPRVADAMA